MVLSCACSLPARAALEVVAPELGRVRVRSCGVCHSDSLGVEGLRPDPSLPIVPGHEIIVVDAVGPDVTAWRVGDRVGVGFLGGHCGECAPCRRGDFVNCTNQPQPGTTEDGGYAEMVYARATGLVRVPEELNPLEAALLLCAGVTTFNALRNADAPFGRWSPDWRPAANSSSWAGRPTRSPSRPPT